jgi:hypothetical protein
MRGAPALSTFNQEFRRWRTEAARQSRRFH